jgi:hypothetical protein
MATKPKRTLTRTTLVGMTSYQPDIQLSWLGRTLLDSLDSVYPPQKPRRGEANICNSIHRVRQYSLRGEWPATCDHHAVTQFGARSRRGPFNAGTINSCDEDRVS